MFGVDLPPMTVSTVVTTCQPSGLADPVGDGRSVGLQFGHHGLVLAHRLIDVSGI